MGEENQDAISPDVSAPENDDVQTGSAEAESSPAEGEQPSLLDVVRSAAPAEEEEAPESPAGEPTDSEAATEEDEASEQTDAPTDAEDDEALPEGTKEETAKRFRKLMGERRELREEVERYKPGFEQNERIQSYLRENGISADEASGALRVQALLKSDPAKAWAEIKPVVQKLLVEIGEVLPGDLRDQVRQGRLSPEHAAEISRSRAREAGQGSRMEHQRHVEQTRQQAQATRDLQDAAASWETAKRQRDPEFDVRSEALQKEVLWLMRTNEARSGDDVRKLLDTAYANVVKAAAPRERRPAKAPLPGSRVSGGTATAAPKSILEIVQRGG